MKKYNDLLDLHLFHQPIVNLVSGKIVGTEALIRMKTEKGYLEPSEFFSDIKESIESLELFKWVLLEALNHKDYFKRCGFDLQVSLNVSAKEMINPYFLLLIDEIFTNNTNEKITLEITEDNTKENIDIIPAIIRRLKSVGINTSIDDFGKELSNFDRLIIYPVDKVKIDRMFVKNITHSETYRDILKTMIDLTSKINKEVIIEGIETIEQAKIITDMGCSLAQGFGICRPIDHKDIPLWIAKSYAEEHWWTKPKSSFNGIDIQDCVIV